MFSKGDPKPSVTQVQPVKATDKQVQVNKVINLANNENPLGTSTEVMEYLKNNIDHVSKYPEQNSNQLCEELAKYYHVTNQNIIVGNGSTELIHLISHTFLKPADQVLVPAPSFPEYGKWASMLGAEVISVPLDFCFNYNVAWYIEKLTPRTKILYLCTPNNPTGTYLKKDQFDVLLNEIPDDVLIVVDQVYLEFCDQEDGVDSISTIKKGRQVIMLRSFSKAYGLAGLRIGYAISTPGIIERLEHRRIPYNVNLIAQNCASIALNDPSFLKLSKKYIETEKAFLYTELEQLNVPFVQSHTNFILIKLDERADHVCNVLKDRDILIKNCQANGLNGYLRVSIGQRENNIAFISALREILFP